MDRGSQNEDQARRRILLDLAKRVLRQVDAALSRAALAEGGHGHGHSSGAGAGAGAGGARGAKPSIRFFGSEYEIPAEIVAKWRAKTLKLGDCMACRVRGSLIRGDCHPLSASSDGELLLLGFYACGILEIKWPGNNQPYSYARFEHMIQMNLTMWIHNYPLCLYASFSGSSYTLSPIHIDRSWLDCWIVPSLIRIFFMVLFPALVHKYVNRDKSKSLAGETEADKAAAAEAAAAAASAAAAAAAASSSMALSTEVAGTIRAGRPAAQRGRGCSSASLTCTRKLLLHRVHWGRPRLPPLEAMS